MSLLAWVVKGALAVVGTGAIVTPVAIKLSSNSYHKKPIVIENFPDKDNVNGKCQVLDREVNSNKYLLACDFERENSGSGVSVTPEFKFFSGNGNPVSISEFKGKETEEGENKITFSTYEYSNTGLEGVTGEESILVSSSSPWVDILAEAQLNKCKFKGKLDSNISWTVECETKSGVKKEIYLAPLSLK
ncbi:hypothetical protein WEN_02240 [Mycoplasma wenyonii str. Massachusetts]|uniref:Uncharacterized protein n=1 Tax=Mycoplasma wenyonii (strain Massachusetts) TaxID=1197325 RepID=I6ZJ46_MYCWM|nr:hypothetical protein [Mycoplasma wenyonii]AFN65235.1 hypothetical protein WEN_02240 [Mycoplasma wenyonii str. Massachusetts]